jgi:hypothetical protein
VRRQSTNGGLARSAVVLKSNRDGDAVDEHAALVGLPKAYRTMFPLLFAVDLPVEHRSTCATCAMAAPESGPTKQRPFAAKAACCTYQPVITNYQLGSALVRGGVGADRVRARLRRQPQSVHTIGITTPADLKELYSPESFGQDPHLTCPFWVPGPKSCSVWADRNGVCRTWHCLTTAGGRSTKLWDVLRELLTYIERSLAMWLADHVDAPNPDHTHPTEAWESWFVNCHQRLESASDAELSAVDFPERQGLEVALQVYLEIAAASLPDVVRPMIRNFDPHPDGFNVSGYNPWDQVLVPREFMALYGLLTQQVPWRDALQQIEQSYGIHFDEAFVQHLWDRGILIFAQDGARSPEVAAWERMAAEHGVIMTTDADTRPPKPG